MDQFLASYKCFEQKHPEMPFVFIRGLYAYVLKLREDLKRQDESKECPLASSNSSSLKSQSSVSESIPDKAPSQLDDFEHIRAVQTIVKEIANSHNLKRWVAVNYWTAQSCSICCLFKRNCNHNYRGVNQKVLCVKYDNFWWILVKLGKLK